MLIYCIKNTQEKGMREASQEILPEYYPLNLIIIQEWHKV